MSARLTSLSANTRLSAAAAPWGRRTFRLAAAAAARRLPPRGVRAWTFGHGAAQGSSRRAGAHPNARHDTPGHMTPSTPFQTAAQSRRSCAASALPCSLFFETAMHCERSATPPLWTTSHCTHPARACEGCRPDGRPGAAAAARAWCLLEFDCPLCPYDSRTRPDRQKIPFCFYISIFVHRCYTLPPHAGAPQARTSSHVRSSIATGALPSSADRAHSSVAGGATSGATAGASSTSRGCCCSPSVGRPASSCADDATGAASGAAAAAAASAATAVLGCSATSPSPPRSSQRGPLRNASKASPAGDREYVKLRAAAIGAASGGFPRCGARAATGSGGGGAPFERVGGGKLRRAGGRVQRRHLSVQLVKVGCAAHTGVCRPGGGGGGAGLSDSLPALSRSGGDAAHRCSARPPRRGGTARPPRAPAACAS